MESSVSASDCRREFGMKTKAEAIQVWDPKRPKLEEEQKIQEDLTPKRLLIEIHKILDKDQFEIFRKLFLKLKTWRDELLSDEIIEPLLQAFFNSTIR